METPDINIIDKAIKHWDRPYGLILLIIAVNFMYRYFVQEYFDFENYEYAFTFDIAIQVLLTVILWVIWIFSTNRFFLRGRADLVLAIHIDDEDKLYQAEIRKVVHSTIREISDTKNLKKVKVFMLPINYLKSKDKTERFLDSRRTFLDSIINLKLNSGKFDSVDKITVHTIDFIGFFDHNLPDKKIFFEKINVRSDIKLTNFHKNWDYLIENNGQDKIKLRKNLLETVLHYAGIYSIYLNKPDLALALLSNIFEYSETVIPNENIDHKNKKIKMQPRNLVAGRLATILIDLYQGIAFQQYHSNKKVEALTTLKECEERLKANKYSFSIYISLARMCFETGDIDGAIAYTVKANAIRQNSYEVAMNKGWFAAIRNRPYDVYSHFKRLYNMGNKKTMNYIDVVEFVQRYKPQYPGSKDMLDFVDGYYNKLYVDTEYGRELLTDVLAKLNSRTDNTQHLIGLTEKVLRINKKHVSNKKRGKRMRRRKRR